jgi:hypothetical protein
LSPSASQSNLPVHFVAAIAVPSTSLAVNGSGEAKQISSRGAPFSAKAFIACLLTVVEMTFDRCCSFGSSDATLRARWPR